MNEQILIFSQIVLIDLVLAGDNAIIIGMVASQFPPDQRKKIIFWGIGGAIILRLLVISPIWVAVFGRWVCQDNMRVFFYAVDGFFEFNEFSKLFFSIDMES